MTMEKIVRCFKASSDGCPYRRDLEIDAIKEFLCINAPILHITGGPGTGKTCTVMWALRSTEFLYVNYFLEGNMNAALRRCSYTVVVIDEFDRYLEEKRSECLRNILSLRGKGKKVITISNNLRLGTMTFKPYTSSEIVAILKEKMSQELGVQVIDDAALMFLSKKFEKTGDLRLVFKAILDAYSKREGTGAEDCQLRLEDFVERRKTVEKGIHHEFIDKLREAGLSKSLAYRNYMKECESVALMPLQRHDFDIIFDFLGCH